MASLIKKIKNFITSAAIIPEFSQIRMELTNICACRCFMCPRDKMTRAQGEISDENLRVILKKLNYIDYPVEIHLHGSGEALLCKDFITKLDIIKEECPNFIPAIVTTLGYDVDLEPLLIHGLKIISISLYGYNREDYKIIHGRDGFDKVIEKLKELAELKKKYDIKVSLALDEFNNYPIDITQEEHQKRKKDFVQFLISTGFSEKEINFSKLHAYGNKKEIEKTEKYTSDTPCSVLWGKRRKILQLDWEGEVVPCCFDMNSEYKFGNILKQSLAEIYTSEKYNKFMKLISKKAPIPLCDGCREFELYSNAEYKEFRRYKRAEKFRNFLIKIGLKKLLIK